MCLSQIQNLFISTGTKPVTTKRTRVVTLWSRAFIDKVTAHKTCSCEVMGQIKNISTTTVPTAIKHVSGVTYQRAATHKSHNPLVTCYISSRRQCLGPPNLTL